MQTFFTDEQLADPQIARSEEILRTCVHCGFCTATCPTYVLLGEENDSPRGRIYLIKDMLENGKPANTEVVKHLDRCLSCLSCMSTCPSGVHYQHLIDHAREHIENTYERPFMDRALRSVLSFMLPSPLRFRLSLMGAQLAKPFLKLPAAAHLPARVRAMLNLAPAHVPPPSPTERPAVYPAEGERKARVALLIGCAQPVLQPHVHEATIRFLNRLGVEVVTPPKTGCCGALVHHMGKVPPSHEMAARNIRAWIKERDANGLDAIVINASGCGTQVKDYGYMFQDDTSLAEDAAAVAGMAKDITEFVMSLGIEAVTGRVTEQSGMTVAYHSACSMQHGQQLKEPPPALLKAAGFKVRQVPEGHLCCGSAGTYNILQPEIAQQLRDRKLANIAKTKPEVIATGNIGCMMQLGPGADVPIVHTVELLDWATGGDFPPAMAAHREKTAA